MESTLKKALGLSVLKPKGSAGGGCISDGKIFDTENGPIFVKVNDGEKVYIISLVMIVSFELFIYYLISFKLYSIALC